MLLLWYKNVKILLSLLLFWQTQILEIDNIGCSSQIPELLLRALSLDPFSFIAPGFRLYILERKEMQEPYRFSISRSCQFNMFTFLLSELTMPWRGP